MKEAASWPRYGLRQRSHAQELPIRIVEFPGDQLVALRGRITQVHIAVRIAQRTLAIVTAFALYTLAVDVGRGLK